MIKKMSFAFFPLLLIFLSSSSFAINGPMGIVLNSKIWNYYPPGALKPGGLLPITKDDGVVAKNINSNQKRIVYLVREVPLTTTAKEFCNLNQKFSSTDSVEVDEKTCFVLGKETDGFRSYQLVSTNVRRLKLLTIATKVPVKQHEEVLKDFKIFKKGIRQ